MNAETASGFGRNDVDDFQSPSGASTRTGHLRAEIEGARERLDGTIDEVEYRLTPEQIMHRTLASCQRAAWKSASKAATLAKEHPLPSAVIGAGILWLVKQALESRERHRRAPRPEVAPARNRVGERIEHAAHSVVEGVKSAGSTAANAVSKAGSSAVQAAASAGSSVADVASTAGSGVAQAARSTGAFVADTAGSVGSGVQTAARKSAEWTDSFVHEYPLGAGAACFALGLAGGLAIPGTRAEDELVGEKRDQLLRQAQHAGSQVLRKSEHVVQQATETVRRAVERTVDSAVDDRSSDEKAESSQV